MSRPAFIGTANLTEWGYVLGLSQQAMSWRAQNCTGDEVLAPPKKIRCRRCGRFGHGRKECTRR